MSDAQTRASDPRGSAWVAASAGTGKTKVLTDRVLRLLLAGTPPERILCITFTKAAAAEMAIRINDTLRRWATVGEAKLAADLAKLLDATPDEATKSTARGLLTTVLDAPGGMRIQTIHAFCQSLLRRFPLESGIAPHFEVADERDAAEMLETAKDVVLERARQGKDEGLAAALDEVTARVSETDFVEVMSGLASFRDRLRALLDRHGGLERLTAATYGLLGVAEDDTPEALIAAASAEGAFDRAGLMAACRALEAGSESDRGRGEAIANWLALPAAERAAAIEGYRGVYLTQREEPRKRVITEKAGQAAPEARRALEVEMARMLTLTQRLKSLGVAKSTAAMLELGAALLDAYRAEKERRALLDYDDQILAVRDLLERGDVAPWVLFKLDGGLDHLLLDEAQDTAPEQWAVIAALAEEFFAGEGARDVERTLFVVGDEKQSIFSFQGAEPRALENMRHAFSERVRNAGKRWSEIPLELSFRSTEAVLKAVDEVFAREEARAGVALSGGPVHHEAKRKGQAGVVEVWPAVAPREARAAKPWRLPLAREPADSPAARLARRIACQVRDWLDRGEVLASRGRPIRAGDIMVLVRRRGEFVDELVRTLKNRDVPVAGVDRLVLTEQIAVMDLVALGHFLLLPGDDLTLATVLKSPLVGLDEEQLFGLAHERGEQSLWQALKEKRHEAPAYAAAHAYLAGLLARADFVPPFELFAEVLGPLGGRKALIGRLGREADDPLDELLALALAYQRSHVPSLQRFLSWIEEGRSEIKRDLEQGRNTVRIITVHGAKGLQAPIVFLPDTLQTPPQKQRVLWLERDPAGVLLWPARKERDDAFCAEARDSAVKRDAEEYRRLLYVAMTRAEDRLYVCGWRTKNEPKAECWYNLVWKALAGIAEPVAFDFTSEGPEGWKGPGLRLVGEQRVEPEGEEAPPGPAAAPPGLPDFARTPAPAEPSPPRPLAPSAPAEGPATRSPLGADEGAGFRRGRLIHRLLQTLPELAPERRAEACRSYLARHGTALSPEEAEAIASETLAVLADPAFAPLFGPGSQAEVPLAALLGERVVCGQVDRLLVQADRILVIDYKTNREPPASESEIPSAYLSQMAAYRAALARIFPARRIRCALLWTDGPRLTPLDDRLLEPYAP